MKHHTVNERKRKNQENLQRHTQLNPAIHGGRLRGHFKLWPDRWPISSNRETINKNIPHTIQTCCTGNRSSTIAHTSQKTRMNNEHCPGIKAQPPTHYHQIYAGKVPNSVCTRRGKNIWWGKGNHSKLNGTYSMRVEGPKNRAVVGTHLTQTKLQQIIPYRKRQHSWHIVTTIT